MAEVSAFIIAKNEEAKVEVALQSLASFVDEIIFVDTGSTDSTKKIASAYTEKIYDFSWDDDFSAARNFALSKCRKDWVFFLDADDEILNSSQQKILALFQNDSKKIVGYYVTYFYGKAKSFLTPRIFRNHFEFQFEMPIHEYLNIPPKFHSQFSVQKDIEIIHHKDQTENQSTLERNIHILQKALKENPKDEHLQFFLGREYFNIQLYPEALQIFENLLFYTHISDQSFLYQIYFHLAKIYENLGEFLPAHYYYQQAFLKDSRFAEPLIYEANLYLYKENKIEQASQLYQKTLNIPKPTTVFPLNPNFYHDFLKINFVKFPSCQNQWL